MNRVLRLARFSVVCAVFAAAWQLGAAHAAPVLRMFPAGSLQGQAWFGAWPQLQVNCVDYTLGPGVRVLDPAQRALLTGQLPGLRGRIVFQRDAQGNVFRVWFLDPTDPSLRAVPEAPSRCLFGNA
ncbi:hypothetical protein GALL_347020 [mine drainage metagenome]|jgi:hypothetical protein|uniref:Uncharacterized protein n=1 Tax=mine drainage metagenome TaxID=410659 RepID=A0A1J5QIX4_9ZZZZ